MNNLKFGEVDWVEKDEAAHWLTEAEQQNLEENFCFKREYAYNYTIYCDGKWYYHDESRVHIYGPFYSKQECENSLYYYNESL